MGPRRGLRLPRSRRSSGDWRTGVSPHYTMACGDVRGRVTDGAGSSVAVEWPDPERPVAIRSQSGGCACALETGWLSPLQMAKRAQSGRREEMNKAEHSGARPGISLGAFRTGKRLFVFSFGCRSYFLQIWCRLYFLSVFGHQSIFCGSSKGCLYIFGNIL